MAQDRPQPARKGKPLLLVHRNLRNAANLVLHRILDGDDLVFVALDLVQRGVKSRRFAGARRPGHQHHPVWLANVGAKAPQILVGKTHHIQRQMVELLAHRLLVQHAQHGIFAVNRRHDGDAEVDQAVLVANAEAAVLRHSPLGNIQLAHDLDAAQNCRVMLAGDGRHSLLQDAVDAVLDMHRVVVSLDVNVRGSPLQSGEDGRVHQANDGADVLFAGQLLDGDILVGVFVAGQHVEGQPFAGLVQHALRLLGLLQQVGNLRKSRHARDDPMREQPGNLIQHHQPRWVADGNHQCVALLFYRHEVVAEHQLDGHGAQQLVLNLEVLQVHELGVIALRQEFRLGALFLRARKRTYGYRNGKRMCGCSHDLLTSRRLSQREDGQVKRDENEDDNNAHHDEDCGLNQRQ